MSEPSPEPAAPVPPDDDLLPPRRSGSARSPVVPALVGWLVPGAGHLMIGRRWPALFVALGTWPILIGGMALSGFENVSWERHPYLFSLQVLCGLPTGIAALLTRTLVATEPFRHHTIGDLYTCAAGLLNLVAIADVWARCTAGDPEERLARLRAQTPHDAPESEPGVETLVARSGPAEAHRE